jgi:hypothetical protein
MRVLFACNSADHTAAVFAQNTPLIAERAPRLRPTFSQGNLWTYTRWGRGGYAAKDLIRATSGENWAGRRRYADSGKGGRRTRAASNLFRVKLVWHNRTMRDWFLALAFGIAGATGGLLYGLYVAPVEYVDTTPASLRLDYRADYVLMVAEAFSSSHDLDVANEELAIFGDHRVEAVAAEALDFGQRSSFAPRDLELIHELMRALQTSGLGSEIQGEGP